MDTEITLRGSFGGRTAKRNPIDETIGNREARARSQRTAPALDRQRIRVSDDTSDDSSSSDDDFTG